jgi:hypothetical protein
MKLFHGQVTRERGARVFHIFFYHEDMDDADEEFVGILGGPTYHVSLEEVLEEDRIELLSKLLNGGVDSEPQT